jgi:hypothetical protein
VRIVRTDLSNNPVVERLGPRAHSSETCAGARTTWPGYPPTPPGP